MIEPSTHEDEFEDDGAPLDDWDELPAEDDGLTYLRGGWGVLPLEKGSKFPPPKGWTGRGSPDMNAADYLTYRDTDHYRDGNLGLRMPDGVVGIDVDDYDGKTGGKTLAEWEERYGSLPDTWTSTSREDGRSMIRFYRVPKGTELHGVLRRKDGGSDVEVVQRHHRYAVVAPSKHPSGRRYQWRDPDGNPVVGVYPLPEDLAELPEAWLEAASREAPAGERSEAVSDKEMQVWLEAHDRPEQCGVMSGTVNRWVGLARKGSAHDSTKDGVHAIVSLANEGHHGLLTSLRYLENGFVSVVSSRPKNGQKQYRSKEEAKLEFRALVQWSIGAMREEDARPGCDCAEALVVEEDEEPAKGRKKKLRTSIEVTDELETVLAVRAALGSGSLSPLFRRGGQLVHAAALSGKGSRGHIEEVVKADHFRLVLSELATLWKEVKPKDGPAFKQLVMLDRQWTGACMASLDTLEGLREVVSVRHSPFLRPDWTVMQDEGYDPQTRCLYLPLRDFPAIQESPSKKDMEKARDRVLDLIGEFPFESPEHRANYLAVMLGPLLMDALDVLLPLAVYTAPSRGSGKTFLAKIIAILHAGSDRVHGGYPKNEEELEKVITGHLLAGTPVVTFDNATGQVGGGMLDAVLTSKLVHVRRLGSSDQQMVPNTALWQVTSNNARITPDLVRRSAVVRLSPGVANPWLRSGFKIQNILNHVETYREEILADLLTMLVYAGKPTGRGARQDSFEEFVHVTEHVLARCGIPCGVMATVEGTHNEEEEEWVEFLNVLEEFLRLEEQEELAKGFRARDLVAAVKDAESWSSGPERRVEELLRVRGQLDPRLVSRWLGQWEGHIVSRTTGHPSASDADDHLMLERRVGHGKLYRYHLRAEIGGEWSDVG